MEGPERSGKGVRDNEAQRDASGDRARGLRSGGARGKTAATLATVDDDGVECPDATQATIQSVVDPVPAGEGGTIVVCAGAYDELVAVTGKGTIRLTGVGDPVLMPPGPTGDGRLLDVSSSRT